MKIISSKKWNEQQTQIKNLMAGNETAHLTITDLKYTISQHKIEICKLKNEITNLKRELENHPKRDISTGKFTKRK
jgi:predicted RNase H-like nuclease (RuvC/YqgF family)